jgi:serine/threonine protein kinase
MSEKSKSNKKDDDNFKLQYSIVYKEPKKIEKISDEARDLLKGLLNKDPKKRLTCEQILNHPWLNDFKEKNISSKKFHLFTKAENVMLSKTFIDYRKANYEDLKENFTLSNLIFNSDKNKQNSKEENITNKSSILAPYNSIITESDDSQRMSIKIKDSFDDFNNSKIKLENELITFNKKIKEYNRLYELNNNGEVDNGVLINSKTQSSINMTDRSDKSKKDIFNLNISNNNSFIIKDLNDSKNINKKNSDDELDKTVKINNILAQMKIMGYNKDYVLDCVKRNELCHASAVYYLMMNYENI